MHPLQAIATTRKVLIIGDVMLDHYVFGSVERVSPEAPVPIVNVEREEYRLGGAANVALNLAKLGVKVGICTLMGQDKEEEILMRLLEEANIQPQLVFALKDRKTTVKTRIIARQQQVLRLDKEDTHLISPSDTNFFIKELSLTVLAEYHAIIFEDYDKGLISSKLIVEVTKKAAKLNIPVFVDPKHRNFFAYEHCFLFKPNLKELENALHTKLDKNDFISLKNAIATLREKMPHRHTLLTLSEKGMIWVNEALELAHFPTKAREVLDVSGAGDTVIAVAALAIAADLPLYQAFELANLAGGMVCEHLGVVPVTWEMLGN